MVIMASSNRFSELHVHLEGALSPQVLLEIDPSLDPAELSRLYAFTDFPGFIEAFKYAVLRLRSADDYRLLARHFFASLAAQGIVYAEVIHSAGINLWRGFDAKAIAHALLEEGARAPLQVRWIFDAVRQLGPDHVMATARFTADFSGSSVVAFGVGGDESVTPAQDLMPAFAYARQSGLRLVPHAGETTNAENVWGALALGADRIGHGIRSIEDPALVRELAARRIPLEISLTSNVLTGAVPSLAAHPAKRLFDAGVPILLNTDDPAFFRTTLAAEFDHAAALGFTASDREQLRQNAFDFAFDFQ